MLQTSQGVEFPANVHDRSYHCWGLVLIPKIWSKESDHSADTCWRTGQKCKFASAATVSLAKVDGEHSLSSSLLLFSHMLRFLAIFLPRDLLITLCSQDNTQSCNYIPEELSLFSNTANVILLVKYRLIP